MDIIEPYARSWDERDAIVDRLSALEGRRIVGCRYHFPPFTDDYQPHMSDSFDVVEGAVWLTFGEAASAAFLWVMDSMPGARQLEGVSVVLDPDIETVQEKGKRHIDAMDRISAPGSDLLVTSIATAWTGTEVEEVAGLWSIRLNFERHSVTIALGSLADDGSITFMPDELVVIRQSDLAKRYQPLAAYQPAWGS